MAKHVDDLKVTGERTCVLDVLKRIEGEFGAMKVEWDNFTNCGVRHRQDKMAKEITLDQSEYILALKTLSHEEL